MITDQINEDIKQAMLAKDKKKLDVLRAIKSALMLLAPDKGADGKFQMKLLSPPCRN